MAAAASCTRVPMHFLKRDSLYEVEASYETTYEPSDGLAQNNTRKERKDGCPIHDMRDCERELSFDTNGFAVLPLDGLDPVPQKYDDEAFVKEHYFPRVATAVREFLHATRVQVFDYRIRKQDAQFPISHGKAYAYYQPASLAHIDTTVEEMNHTRKTIEEAAGRTSAPPSHLRCQHVNVWRPLSGPVRQWPLALCDAASVDAARDLERHHIVGPRRVKTQFLVHASPEQRWYYLRDQMPNEALLFRQADSAGSLGVPHSAFPHPDAAAEDVPRESIEVRLMVYTET